MTPTRSEIAALRDRLRGMFRVRSDGRITAGDFLDVQVLRESADLLDAWLKQEPVAWRFPIGGGDWYVVYGTKRPEGTENTDGWEPLYALPTVREET